jgi:dienelactone hydrolase
MVEIVLFHSVLGLRPAVHATADRFRAAGHVVHTPDLYDGEVFDSYEPAFAFVEERGGVPWLVQRTTELAADLPTDVVHAGFSNGGASAVLLATGQPGSRGALLLHSALPPQLLGHTWPAGLPAQVHYAELDPFRRPEWIAQFTEAVQAAGADLEFFDYSGVRGHLFTDPDLPDHDAPAAELAHERALAFLARLS